MMSDKEARPENFDLAPKCCHAAACINWITRKRRWLTRKMEEVIWLEDNSRIQELSHAVDLGPKEVLGARHEDCVITKVREGSPASKAGLEVGMRVVAVVSTESGQEKRVMKDADLEAAISQAGTSFEVVVVRELSESEELEQQASVFAREATSYDGASFEPKDDPDLLEQCRETSGSASGLGGLKGAKERAAVIRKQQQERLDRRLESGPSYGAGDGGRVALSQTDIQRLPTRQSSAGSFRRVDSGLQARQSSTFPRQDTAGGGGSHSGGARVQTQKRTVEKDQALQEQAMEIQSLKSDAQIQKEQRELEKSREAQKIRDLEAKLAEVQRKLVDTTDEQTAWKSRVARLEEDKRRLRQGKKSGGAEDESIVEGADGAGGQKDQADSFDM